MSVSTVSEGGLLGTATFDHVPADTGDAETGFAFKELEVSKSGYMTKAYTNVYFKDGETFVVHLT
jgi:hypothetical protein